MLFKITINKKNIALKSVFFVLLNILFVGVNAYATDVKVLDIANNVNATVHGLAIIMSDVSLVAGLGFVMASFFKFHQHKLNPTQVPMSQGITLLIIGIGLALFPTLITTAKDAVFGSQEKVTKVGGNELGSLIGASGTAASS